MAKIKETDWYEGWQKPVNVGVYKRKYISKSIWYCYWDGRYFYKACSNPDEAKSWRYSVISVHQEIPWKGVRK